jgi:hypothetical protein
VLHGEEGLFWEGGLEELEDMGFEGLPVAVLLVVMEGSALLGAGEGRQVAVGVAAEEGAALVGLGADGAGICEHMK